MGNALEKRKAIFDKVIDGKYKWAVPVKKRIAIFDKVLDGKYKCAVPWKI